MILLKDVAPDKLRLPSVAQQLECNSHYGPLSVFRLRENQALIGVKYVVGYLLRLEWHTVFLVNSVRIHRHGQLDSSSRIDLVTCEINFFLLGIYFLAHGGPLISNHDIGAFHCFARVIALEQSDVLFSCTRLRSTQYLHLDGIL